MSSSLTLKSRLKNHGPLKVYHSAPIANLMVTLINTAIITHIVLNVEKNTPQSPVPTHAMFQPNALYVMAITLLTIKVALNTKSLNASSLHLVKKIIQLLHLKTILPKPSSMPPPPIHHMLMLHLLV